MTNPNDIIDALLGLDPSVPTTVRVALHENKSLIPTPDAVGQLASNVRAVQSESHPISQSDLLQSLLAEDPPE